MKIFVKKHRDLVLYAVVIVVAGFVLWAGHQMTTGRNQGFARWGNAPVYQAKVKTILAHNKVNYEIDGKAMTDSDIHFYADITSGDKKGDILIARQINNAMLSVPLKEIEEGDRVMIVYGPYENEGDIWLFQEYDRSLTILVLLFSFFGLLLLFGGKKGIGAMLSLIFTCLCIFYFFLPAILMGWNVYGLTIFSCIFVIAVTLILVNGFNFKSLSAAIGCVGGLIVAGLLFQISDKFLKLTGMVDEESSYLLYMNPGNPINLKGIIFASVLIGVLGAVLDVGVSIAASLNEIYGQRDDFTFEEVVSSGMNIGRDIISTMANTLILAYIGGALSLTLLLMTYSNSLLELINREIIVVELLQALLGSIGLLFTIPLTTLFYAFALIQHNKKAVEKRKKVSVAETVVATVEEIEKEAVPEHLTLDSVKRLEEKEKKQNKE